MHFSRIALARFELFCLISLFLSRAACQCNGHSSCVNESVCERCEDLTTGKQCESCISGYYGDPTNGGTCQRESEARAKTRLTFVGHLIGTQLYVFFVGHLQHVSATAMPACVTLTTASASVPPRASKETAAMCKCARTHTHTLILPQSLEAFSTLPLEVICRMYGG